MTKNSNTLKNSDEVLNCILPYTLIEVSGEDNISFLQGLLTQNIKGLSDDKIKYSGFCNHKGRLISTMLCYKNGDNVIIKIHNKIADLFLEKIKRFVFRSKVQFNVRKDRVFVSAKKEILTHPDLKNTTDAFDISLYKEDNVSLMINSIINGISIIHLDCKSPIKIKDNNHQLGNFFLENIIKFGEFNIYPETSEKILPQTTTLDIFNGVSYEKGCYIGQEIIARSKYLGKIKSTSGYFELILEDIEEYRLLDYKNLRIRSKKDDKDIGFVIDFFLKPIEDTKIKVSFMAVVQKDYIEKDAVITINDHSKEIKIEKIN